MDRLSRRQFVQGMAGTALLAGCGRLAGPAPSPRPKPATVPRLGWLALASLTDDLGAVPLLEAFREGLRDQGWFEGQNLTMDYRSAEGRGERLPGLAAELVALQPDVIVAAGSAPAALAAKNATGVIPVVFTIVGDPVGQGLVDSLARPGKNVTGLSSMSPALSRKRLELLREAVPSISRVGVFWNPGNPDSAVDLQQTQGAAQALAVQLHTLELRGPDEVETDLDAASRARVEAVLVLGDALTRSLSPRIAAFAAEAQFPSMFASTYGVYSGGLMTYGPDTAALFRRTAYYVDRILKGAQPADLPVEQPREFVFVINLKTAHALGLTIPQHVLLQATEVIQ